MDLSIIRSIYSAGSWGLARLFGQKQLQECVFIMPRPLRDGVRVDCLAGTLNVWIRVINASPFDFSIDHCKITFVFAGFSVQLDPEQPQEVKAFSENDIFFKSNLVPDHCVAAACQEINSSDPYIDYAFKFVNKFTSFIMRGSLSQIPFMKINDKALIEQKRTA